MTQEPPAGEDAKQEANSDKAAGSNDAVADGAHPLETDRRDESERGSERARAL